MKKYVYLVIYNVSPFGPILKSFSTLKKAHKYSKQWNKEYSHLIGKAYVMKMEII